MQSERLQRFPDWSFFINRPLVETPSRNADVPAGSIPRGRDLAFGQRVTLSHDSYEIVSKQGLRAHLRGCRLRNDPSLQIDRPITKWRAVFVWFLHEAQPDAWSLFADARQQGRSEVLHKTFASTEREGSDESLEVEILNGT